MLKTSPILTSSTNASPTSFRHGLSSRTAPLSDSSALSMSPMPRRQSSRSASSASASIKSPRPPPRPRHQEDGGAVASSSASSVAVDPPPPPRPLPLVKDATSVAASPAQPSTRPPPDALSPNKRRSSPAGNISPSETGHQLEEPPQASKRAKPDDQPPKILPQRYEFCAVEDMVILISHMLAELIATNDAIRISNGGLTRFHSRTPPGISVRDYLHRLAKHATLSPPLLLAMVYYIDRLCALYQEFTINTLTVHRFLITAATVAAKGLSDSFWNNTTYARVGGVRVAELNLLELEFLHRVDWKIVPNPEVLVAYYRGLVERTPGYDLEPGGSSDDELDEDDDVDSSE